ncbi:MAG: hypothetical protein J5666_01040 [Bacilli bacterium]|nr:hypothetical protein [Bacilli bacterium]
MKKISNNTSLIALVLGAIMILYSLGLISDGGTDTVIGIFGLLFGVAYIFAAVITMLSVSNTAVDLTKTCIYIAAFPLFMFVYYLCLVIQAADRLTITNWIIIILILIAALCAATCSIISLVGKNDTVKKIGNLSILIFIGLLIIMLVFPVGNVANTLGNLSLVQVMFILGYFLVTSPFIELPGGAKKESTEEKTEEAPKEEPVEETADEPAEEPAEEPKEEALQ